MKAQIPTLADLQKFLVRDIDQVVVKHMQGNQPSPDGGRGSSYPLLPFDKAIDIVYGDPLGGPSSCPFEKDAHIARVVNRCTGARFPAPPVFLEAIDLFLGKHKSPPEAVALV
ncbi:MAG: hypothetical protein MUO76_05345 [Anaerolineaceae bacterium]|nr:hypothetical protein [Anaerolineaceae bacterium]